MIDQEMPIPASEARVRLGCGASRMSAIKNAMGISRARFVFMSQILKFLKQNPDFTEADVYQKQRAEKHE